MRADWGNHDEKLGLERISCATRFTVPDTAGTCPDPVSNNTDSRSCEPTHPHCTADFSYPLVSSTSFSSSFTSLSISSPTLPSSENTKLSHPSPSLHAIIMRWHRVHHTPSRASTQDCVSSRHSHDYKLTSECRFSFRHATWYDWPPWACSPWELKGIVVLSHSHSCELTNWWIESQHPAHHPSTTSKYSSNLARSWHPSASQKKRDNGIGVHL